MGPGNPPRAEGYRTCAQCGNWGAWGAGGGPGGGNTTCRWGRGRTTTVGRRQVPPERARVAAFGHRTAPTGTICVNNAPFHGSQPSSAKQTEELPRHLRWGVGRCRARLGSRPMRSEGASPRAARPQGRPQPPRVAKFMQDLCFGGWFNTRATTAVFDNGFRPPIRESRSPRLRRHRQPARSQTHSSFQIYPKCIAWSCEQRGHNHIANARLQTRCLHTAEKQANGARALPFPG